jgi:hypothetical protein
LCRFSLRSDKQATGKAALKAARDQYAILKASAEKEAVERPLATAKQSLAAARRAKVNPSLPGPTTAMIARGDGSFVPGETAYPSPDSKQRAISDAEVRLEKAELDLSLWKSGKLKINATIRDIPTEKPKIGSVGSLPLVKVVALLDDCAIVRLLQRGEFSSESFILKGVAIDGNEIGEARMVGGVFWISGKSTVAKKQSFVIEPLPPED